jgi:ribose-phosphate pyrophosphokinase
MRMKVWDSGDKMELRIISGTSNLELAEDMAKHTGIRLTKRTIKRFKDGEIYVKIEESVRGDDVFIIQSMSNSVNDNLMELLIMIDALKRASAGRITTVLSYYGYSRQDRKAEAREPISAKLVADMLTVAGSDRLLAVDLHVPQIQGFFNIPVDEISAIPLFSEYFLDKKKDGEDFVVVAPDIGGAKRARNMAKILDCPIAIIDKRRTAHNDSEVLSIVGEIEGKAAIIIDDIIDTGNSIANAAKFISKDTKRIYLCATHAVFSDGCIDRLNESPVDEIVVSNTVPVSASGKIKVISVAKFLSQIIMNINKNKSVSELFYK